MNEPKKKKNNNQNEYILVCMVAAHIYNSHNTRIEGNQIAFYFHIFNFNFNNETN